MVTLFLGLAAGMAHVLLGPDHLGAVAPLSTESRKRPWLAGFLWGVGHTSGFWIVGLLALLMQGPWLWLGFWGDSLSSLGLVALGLWGLYRTLNARIHRRQRDLETQLRHYLTRRRPQTAVPARFSCAFGILHGLGGSSHYLGVLPALAFSSGLDSALYLIGFGAATIGSMVAFAWGIGRLATGDQTRYLLRLGCSTAALGVGSFSLLAHL